MSKHERNLSKVEKMAVGTRQGLRILVSIIRDLENRITELEKIEKADEKETLDEKETSSGKDVSKK